MQIFSHRLGRLPLPALAAATVLAAVPAGTAATPATPAKAAGPAAALLRRLNATRAGHGLAQLRADQRLARAATRHSRDMVVHRYFSHDSRSGARFRARIARVGWMRGRRHWRVGETLAWGSSRRTAAPRSIVAAWLASPAHRRIVLSPAFRVVGIGVARGTPNAGRGGRTYTADFGS